MYTFPKNFIWGAATSGPQSEGNFKNDIKMFLTIGILKIQVPFMLVSDRIRRLIFTMIMKTI